MLKALLTQVLPKPKRASAHAAQTPLQRAAAFAASKQWDAARGAAEEVLAAEPENLEAILLRAKSFRARGLLEQAQQAYRRALVLAPACADAWIDLGVCHHLAGDDLWARIYFRFAAELDPDNADVWNEFAVVDIALGNYEKAEEALENAVARNPALPEAWNNLGLVLARRGDRANARRHFLRAAFLKPDYYTAYTNAGLAARDLGLLEEAEADLRRALEIDLAPHTAWLNLGTVLQDAGRLIEARAAIDAAVERAPNDSDVLAAHSTLSLREGDPSRAQEIASRAVARDPQHPEAKLALGLAQLAAGNFAEGWRNHEARLRSAGMTVRHMHVPLWQGEASNGQSILVWGEQGLGDEIMFASCLPDLCARGVRCTLDCSPRLRALFKRSFPGITLLEAEAPPVDRSIAIGSLPSLFRTRRDLFPRHNGYLRPDPGRQVFWRERVAALGLGRKIGVAWRGGLSQTGRVQRSVSIEQLLPLLRLAGVHWVNLQHDAFPAELDRMRESGIRVAHWADALADLDETAAVMANLDLVVTVCSTVVHLAGGLGRPAWVLTPRGAAWRYLAHGSEMPWYPSVVLYRQTDHGDWGSVVDRVAADIERAC
ncbi:MAG TPA: tetratricopeptide repeat protein [Burkholderiales bacterium]|nr:tetratricopeptide repeat protein [Burkholderiales bacterium]